MISSMFAKKLLGACLFSPSRGEGGETRGAAGDLGKESLVPQAFTLRSESLSDGGIIPDRLALDAGVSPHLAWRDPPKGTARFVIIMDDPDAQRVVGHTFVHWIACVSARITSLPEGASGGGWTGKLKRLSGACTNTAYGGPKPPPSSGSHRYFIKVYAMGPSFDHPDFQDLARRRAANDTQTYTRERFESRFRSHILASAEISGTYSAGPDPQH